MTDLRITWGLRAAVLLGALLLVSLSGARTIDAVGPVPRLLNTNGGSDSATDVDPRLATDGNGQWVAVWTALLGSGTANILSAHSSDDGETWSAPIQLNPSVESINLGDVQLPVIGTDSAGTWIAVWSSRYPMVAGDDGDQDLVYARSFDNGASWSAPQLLNSNAPGAVNRSQYEPSISYGNGAWVAAWEGVDPVSFDTDIFFTRSLDSGMNWSPAETLTPSSENVGGAIYDRHVDLATDGQGTWIATWSMNVNGGTYHHTIYVQRSTDNGATWPERFDPMPVDPGYVNSSVETDGIGNWLVTFGAAGFYTAADSYVMVSNDGGSTWSSPVGQGVNLPFYGFEQVYTAGNWVIAWQYQNYGRTASTSDGLFWSAPSKATLKAPLAPGQPPDRGITIEASSAGRIIIAYESGDDIVYSFCTLPDDMDCDSLPAASDGCPDVHDYYNLDSDNDGFHNACDRCAFWANPSQAGPPWPAYEGDDDCDGFVDTYTGFLNNAPEAYIGTDPFIHCAQTPGANNDPLPDVWPADFNDDRVVNGQDTGKFGGPYGSYNKQVSDGPFGPPGQELPGERFDFSGNGIINGQDTGKFQAYFGRMCTP